VPIANRGPVPATISGTSVNLTATEPTAWGFVTAFPTGSSVPNASNLNYERAWQTIANHAILPVGNGGISLVPTTDTHLIVDLNGYYTA
jgi:hypothetical protein